MMNLEPMFDDDQHDAVGTPAPSRLAVGGVSAVMAVAIAISAVLGTWSAGLTAGMVGPDRLSDGFVARCVAVAIVRGMERARVRDQDVPSATIEVGRSTRACWTLDIEADVAQVCGGVSILRLGPTAIDLPPPSRC